MNLAADAPPPATKLTGHGQSGMMRWQKLRDALVALSLANLCLVTTCFGLLYDADLGYFNRLRVTSLTLFSLVLNLSWLSGLIWLVMRLYRSSSNRWFRRFCHLFFLLLLLLPVDFCRIRLIPISDHQIVTFLRSPLGAMTALLVLAVVLWQLQRVARAAAVIVGVLSPLAIFTLFKIALLGLGLQHVAQHSADPALQPLLPVHGNQPRLVWFIFDEADQRLAFERRPTFCKLPAFDRLSAESIGATNAFSPGDTTFVSMPALLAGRRFSSVAVRSASDLTVTLGTNGAQIAWSELPSVFKSARDLGVNGAVVGWCHPYDRLLANALSYCTWYPTPIFEQARGATFGETMERQIGCMAGTPYLRQRFASLCQASLVDSLSLVTNSVYGLILLHLAPPHRPGIYLPDRDRYTIFGMPKATGYFNNLALADRFLGQLRCAMETSGQWDKSWVIISADHSWRDSRLYDGVRDLRVPFLVKAPGAGQHLNFAPRMNTVLTHDLILAILQNQVTNQTSALHWLNGHQSDEPPVFIDHHD